MNIILISLDTTRADHLSCYGYPRPTSPHLDRIAAQGTLFTEFYSPHIPTFPGHTTLLTGRDIYAHQVTGQSSTPELSGEIPTLAEIFSTQGWFTGAADNLGRWFARGFQRYESYHWDTSQPREWRKGEVVTAAALHILHEAATQEKPFFLFFHYWDPHTPYLPPAPFSRMFYEGDEFDPNNHSMDPVWAFENFKWYFHEWMPNVTDIEFPKAQYDAEIAYMDACLAHLFTRLEELHLTEETLLVITADHGEELDEHGCWFDHHGLYEPNIHVPLILHWPGRIPAGMRIAGFTRMQDLAPTLLDYAGLLDSALRFDGVSLRPLIEKGGGISRGTCDALHLSENTWMKKRGLRTHEWKLIVSLEPDIHGFPMTELYHLTTDPEEKHNLAEERLDVTHELRGRLEGHVRRRVAETGLPDPLPLQPIPLKRIGKMEQAVPEDKAMKEEKVAVPSTPRVRPSRRNKEEATPAADEKLREGDFAGYEREE